MPKRTKTAPAPKRQRTKALPALKKQPIKPAPIQKPKRIKADPAELIKMVKDALNQKEIMAHFGFKTSTQLTVAYTNALMETGAIPEINKGRAGKKASKEVTRDIVVGKRGSLILPKPLVEEMGLSEGDRFFVKKSKAGLTLARKYQ